MNRQRDGTPPENNGAEDPNVPREVFRGHFDECVEHLRTALLTQLPSNLKGADRQRKPIADFCGITNYHAASLLKGVPRKWDWYLIKFLCYLDMVGYKVIDLENMHPSIRGFLELIGYGLLDPRSACTLVGYSQTSSIYEVFKGGEGISAEKLQLMWDEWKKQKEELERKKAYLRGKYFITVPTDFIPGDRKEKFSPSPATQNEVVSRKAASRQPGIVCVMQGLLVLLEERSSGGRYVRIEELRGSAGIVLSLSAQLSAISSQLLGSEGKKGDLSDGRA